MEYVGNYIDLFAGCGGLSLGLHESGWNGVFAVEKSPLAFSTLKHNLIDKRNHFTWPSWLEKKEHDINQLLKNHREQLINLRDKVDMIVGGPPCQGFSSAGQRNESDHRNGLVSSYIDFIRLVQPKIIFFENVKGFTMAFDRNNCRGKKYSDYVQAALKKNGKNHVGYNVCGKLIDFSDFGIPQKRTRFILVGIRKDIDNNPEFTAENFFSELYANRFKFLSNKGLEPQSTIEDAISDLLQSNGMTPCPDSKGFKSAIYANSKNIYQSRLRSSVKDREVPDSHRFAKHREETIQLFTRLISDAPKGKKLNENDKQKYKIKKRGLVVLDAYAPAPTITSHPDDYVHYSEPRILTVRECARIQSFPDNFEFKEKYTTGGKLRKMEVPRYTQVGNAIPPLFGEQAGQELMRILHD